jgi:hypothetical protein
MKEVAGSTESLKDIPRIVDEIKELVFETKSKFE